MQVEFWTTRHKALLCKLHGEGVPLGEIAKSLNQRFGTSRTLESVRSYATVLLKLRRPGRRPGVTWTDAMEQTLRDGVNALHTMAQIGRSMNLPASAVNKKRIQLGIEIPQGARRSPEEQARRRAASDQRRRDAAELKRRNTLMNIVPPEYRKPAPLILAPDPVTDPLNLTMDELAGRHQCRWITSDALSPPLYCGHPTHAGTSWCEKHHLAVTRPTKSAYDEPTRMPWTL